MKAEKISNALNYLDEDLIAECDNMIKARASKKAPRKATVVPLFGSIAAAAIVLVVGGALLFNFFTEIGDFHEDSNAPAVRTEVVRVDAGEEQGDSPSNAAEEVEAEAVIGDDASPDTRQFDSNIGISQRASVTFDGQEYIVSDPLTAGQRNGNVIGDELGEIEDSDNDELIGAAVYAYNPDADNSIVIYIESSDIYYLAVKAES